MTPVSDSAPHPRHAPASPKMQADCVLGVSDRNKAPSARTRLLPDTQHVLTVAVSEEMEPAFEHATSASYTLCPMRPRSGDVTLTVASSTLCPCDMNGNITPFPTAARAQPQDIASEPAPHRTGLGIERVQLYIVRRLGDALSRMSHTDAAGDATAASNHARRRPHATRKHREHRDHRLQRLQHPLGYTL